METMIPFKPTKEQRQIMKSMEKLFTKNYGIIAKKYRYKFSQLSAFKIEKDFFFHAFANLNNLSVINNYLEIYITLKVKPYKIDDLFWEIFDIPENKKEPLSLRANGAFAILGPTLLERQSVTIDGLIPNEENILKIIEKGMELINNTIKNFLDNWNIETFDVNKFKFVGVANDKTLMEILLEIINGNYKKALDLANEQLNKNEKGRYVKLDGTGIYSMIKEYCKNRI